MISSQYGISWTVAGAGVADGVGVLDELAVEEEDEDDATEVGKDSIVTTAGAGEGFKGHEPIFAAAGVGVLLENTAVVETESGLELSVAAQVFAAAAALNSLISAA